VGEVVFTYISWTQGRLTNSVGRVPLRFWDLRTLQFNEEEEEEEFRLHLKNSGIDREIDCFFDSKKEIGAVFV